MFELSNVLSRTKAHWFSRSNLLCVLVLISFFSAKVEAQVELVSVAEWADAPVELGSAYPVRGVLATTETSQGTFIYLASDADFGVSIFRLMPNHNLEFVDSVVAAGAANLDRPTSPQIVSIGAQPFLLLQGQRAVYRYRIGEDGRLSDSQIWQSNSVIKNYEVVERGQDAFLYIATGNEFFVYKLDAQGQLEQVGDSEHVQISSFSHVRSGVDDYLLFEGEGQSVLSSRIEADGTLNPSLDSIELGLYGCCITYPYRWSAFEVAGLGYINLFGTTFRIRENGGVETLSNESVVPEWSANIQTQVGSLFAFVSDATTLSVGQAGPDGRPQLTHQNMEVFELGLGGIRQPILVRNGNQILAIAPITQPTNRLAVYRINSEGVAEFLSSYGPPGPRHLPARLTAGDVGSSSFIFGGDPFNQLISTFRADGTHLELLHTTVGRPLDLTFVLLGQSPFVYVADRTDQQINAYSVGTDGELTLEHSLDLTIGPQGVLEHDVLFGEPRLIGIFNESIAVMSLPVNGEAVLESQLSISRLSSPAFAISRLGERVYIYVSSTVVGGEGYIEIYEIFADDTISFVSRVESLPELSLNGITHIDTYSVGDENYLVATSTADEGLNILHIQPDGSLVHFDRIENSTSFPIGGWSRFDVFEVGEQTYLAQPGDARRGLSLMSVDSEGRWWPVDFLESGEPIGILDSVDVLFADLGGNPSLLVSDAYPSTLIQLGFQDRQTVELSYISAGRGLLERTNADELVFDIGFSQSVQNVSIDDFEISGTTANGFLTGSEGRYSVTLAGGDLPSLNGPVFLSLRTENDIQSVSGAALQQATTDIIHTFQLDNLPNTIVPDTSRVDASNTVDSTQQGFVRRMFEWSFEFEEYPLNLTEDDIIIETTEGVQASSVIISVAETSGGIGRIYGTFETPDNTVGSVTFTINPLSDILDSVGNGNGVNGYSPSSSVSIPYENIRPTAQITGSSSYANGPFWVDIVFNETVSGLTANGLRLVNGQLNELNRISDTRYRALILPLARGDVEVALLEGAVQDVYENPVLSTPSLLTEYDPDLPRLITRVEGLGSGRLYSGDQGIDCGFDCQGTFLPGTAVSVFASADPGSTFAGWTQGPCVDQSVSSCDIILTEDLTLAARFVAEVSTPSVVFGAVLPAARSGNLGGADLTAFATIIAAGGFGAQSCLMAANDNAPVSLRYWQVDETNTPTGPANPSFDIPTGQSMSFVLALTPTATTTETGFEFFPNVICENGSMDPVSGVNSLQLTIGSQLGPDVISIGVTPTQEGILRVPFGSAGAFSAAGLNIGTGDGSTGNANDATITVSADTGQNTQLPLNLTLCRTDAVTGVCLTSPSSTVESVMPTNEAQTFSIFAAHTSDVPIAFDPANARIFLRFTDADNILRSVTSVAVMTYSTNLPSQMLVGRWSVLIRHVDPERAPLSRGSLFIDETGQALLDDGHSVHRIQLTNYGSDPQTGLVSFFAEGQSGLLTAEGQIVVGQIFGGTEGTFWGVEDVRVPTLSDWPQSTERYGDLYLDASGEIRGSLGECSVYGRFDGSIFATLSLTGCVSYGAALAVIDLPINENGSARLLVSGGSVGWRLENR